MKGLIAYTISLISVFVALIVVWFLGKDLFPILSILLIIYLLWKTFEWIRLQKN